ncbi:unnamed protein product [Soboliphyme baturini]|uniref:CEP209_CC5 domain-containing protein n=1 Tax=Soboliphyme baturini TaxID=241478 RepID=A0A183J8L7_9BILA|nr:unnamed protein product [Soboliphyme baturini]
MEELQRKLASRNQEVIQLLDDITASSHANEALGSQVNQLKINLEESVRQMEMTSDECDRLKNDLDKAHQAIEILQTENAEMKSQLESLEGLQQKEAKIDNEIMDIVDDKIKEWKAMVLGKDKEIESYKIKIQNLEEKLAQLKLEPHQSSALELKELLEEREREIVYLSNELKEATLDMDANVMLMEDLQKQLSSGRLEQLCFMIDW